MSQPGRKSILSRQSISRPSSSRPSTSRPSVSRPSISRPSISRQSVSRPSGIHRQSSVGGSAKVDVKANFSQNVKDILFFLTERDYPKTLTKKNLTNPTENTFKEVIKFIIRDIYPDFECQRVFESVTDLMTGLDYPYALKSSFFKPVGSPHTWPHLLEALNWLCGMIKIMDYERNHISQLINFNCKDDEEADAELEHITFARELYKEFNETGDMDEIKRKYSLRQNVDGKIAHLEKENQRLTANTQRLEEEIKLWPSEEEDLKNSIEKATEKLEVTKTDKKELDTVIAAHQAILSDKQNKYDEKCNELAVLKSELENLNKENEGLEATIANQPPQHEVQGTKQLYKDLLHKKEMLDTENKKMSEDNAKREVLHSKRQRELKAQWRTLINDIKQYVPNVKYDYDRAIDNKHLMQAAHILSVVKGKVAERKEDVMVLEGNLFKQKMEIQRLEDDERLSSEQLIRQKNDLKKMEEQFEAERKKIIEDSRNLSNKLEQTQRSVVELEHQLNESQSYEAIEDKLKQEDNEIAGLVEELRIYKAMMEHQNAEMVSLREEYLNKNLYIAHMQRFIKEDY